MDVANRTFLKHKPNPPPVVGLPTSTHTAHGWLLHVHYRWIETREIPALNLNFPKPVYDSIFFISTSTALVNISYQVRSHLLAP